MLDAAFFWKFKGFSATGSPGYKSNKSRCLGGSAIGFGAAARGNAFRA
jgi:hypothetical protein